MNRAKTFDATGIAPGGRLFAGDLNLIQDLAAALTDLTQNHSVGTLIVGESGLTLSRFGAGEMQLAGAFRVQGILRALNGFVGGTYTTTARDAIPAGSRPYGLVILNQTTNQYEWNSGTDAAPVWQAIAPSIGAGSIGSTQLATDAVTTVKVQAGAITLPKLDAAVPVIPLGAAIDWPWGSGNIPSWAVLCYGQLLTQAAYPGMQTLADAAGRPHGGSAGVNFNTPDYRGRVAVGKDDMGGTAANRITVAVSGVAGTVLGGVFGSEGITLTTGQLPAHNHSITGSPSLSGAPSISDPGHHHVVPASQGGTVTNYSSPTVGGNISSTPEDTLDAFTGITIGIGSLAAGVGTLGTANSGSGSAHQNTQPSIIVNKIMRVL